MTNMSRDEPVAPQSFFNPLESSTDLCLSSLDLNKHIICMFSFWNCLKQGLSEEQDRTARRLKLVDN